MKNQKYFAKKNVLVFILVLFSAFVYGQKRLIAVDFEETNACLFKANDGLLKKVNGGDYIAFHDVVFDKDYVVLEMHYTSVTEGEAWVEIREGSVDGQLLGSVEILPSTDWQTLRSNRTSISNVSQGVVDVVFLFKGTSHVGNFEYFEFSELTSSVESVYSTPNAITPNPTSGVINISQPANVSSLSLHTLNGEQLFISSEVTSQMDISFLPAGMYLAKLTCNEGVFVHKIIKK